MPYFYTKILYHDTPHVQVPKWSKMYLKPMSIPSHWQDSDETPCLPGNVEVCRPPVAIIRLEKGARNNPDSTRRWCGHAGDCWFFVGESGVKYGKMRHAPKQFCCVRICKTYRKYSRATLWHTVPLFPYGQPMQTPTFRSASKRWREFFSQQNTAGLGGSQFSRPARSVQLLRLEPKATGQFRCVPPGACSVTRKVGYFWTSVQKFSFSWWSLQ